MADTGNNQRLGAAVSAGKVDVLAVMDELRGHARSRNQERPQHAICRDAVAELIAAADEQVANFPTRTLPRLIAALAKVQP